ncbi:Type IV fimbrial assembly protein PilC [Lysobacter capsici AZ78]|uniref:Type IV fimbrial assembly protein PilC n=1 Tax=Lysobacter capsici AZ78 TaxID=1444315 RepID=A0A120AHU6_9GAMM|nr:type II secretion system F family protein [Lysobacter capsici]KWS06710.1 Type IV fimbrial assembly protein PilC [Lysobacter capsici AZ78]WND79506.1 type II secretion system F family protein [Lysobacter capsici]WND84702.1 type II secretion system F family protein [Lysobacter capsici]
MSATRSATKTPTPVRRANPLDVFVWQGTDKRGITMKGEQAAKNANLLRAELRRQGITPTVVKPKGKPLFGAAGKRITPGEIAIFSRQIATMMKSGVPIVTSLEIIGEGHKNPRMKKLLNTVRADLESGSSLHEAMSKHPVQFDELYRNLVKAGESAGVLETVLDTVASYKENIETLKGKIKKALFYPATVVAVAILVSAILLIFVVPQFQATFKSFGADLPAFTLMVIGMSDFMIKWWWAVLILVVGAAVAFIMAKNRSPAFAHFLDRAMLKIPVVGQILHNAAIARFARTLAVTFRAGVPLVEALDTVAGATGNVVYEKAVYRIRDDVSVGYQVNMAMKQVNLFPHMVVQMTAIGEEAGALDTMLVKVAEFYEQEVNNAVDALSSLLEPLIMVILGVIVGGMVIAMYLPIFKLAATI